MNIPVADFATFLQSLNKEKLFRIYLNNNICILAKPKNLQFFDNYLTYCGKLENGTVYFPDQKKIYTDDNSTINNIIMDTNIVPYSAICLIAETQQNN